MEKRASSATHTFPKRWTEDQSAAGLMPAAMDLAKEGLSTRTAVPAGACTFVRPRTAPLSGLNPLHLPSSGGQAQRQFGRRSALQVQGIGPARRAEDAGHDARGWMR
jgi:hypothetical protein